MGVGGVGGVEASIMCCDWGYSRTHNVQCHTKHMRTETYSPLKYHFLSHTGHQLFASSQNITGTPLMDSANPALVQGRTQSPNLQLIAVHHVMVM